MYHAGFNGNCFFFVALAAVENFEHSFWSTINHSSESLMIGIDMHHQNLGGMYILFYMGPDSDVTQSPQPMKRCEKLEICQPK